MQKIQIENKYNIENREINLLSGTFDFVQKNQFFYPNFSKFYEINKGL